MPRVSVHAYSCTVFVSMLLRSAPPPYIAMGLSKNIHGEHACHYILTNKYSNKDFHLQLQGHEGCVADVGGIVYNEKEFMRIACREPKKNLRKQIMTKLPFELKQKVKCHKKKCTCKTTAVEDRARPLPMTIAAGPGRPATRETTPTTTAVTRNCKSTKKPSMHKENPCTHNTYNKVMDLGCHLSRT